MSSHDEKYSEQEWTSDQIIHLVNEYKMSPVLWNSKHPLFRVQTAKYGAWCELADKFDCDIVDLKKKFNSIFASHRREKSKVRFGGWSTWFLYNHLSFLPSHVSHGDSSNIQRKVKSEKIEENEAQSSEESEDNSRESPINVLVKEETQVVDRSGPKAEYAVSRPRLTRILKKKVSKSNHAERKRLMRRPTFLKKKDECDSFGEYIALSLRKHDERTRSMIKQAINNILFEQEMKKYNGSNSQYVVISAVEENPLV